MISEVGGRTGGGYFRLPYAVLRRLGATEHWLGLRSTVEMYQLRHHVAWMVHTAVKDD
ncbi:hypothetical protein [Kitasatospora purpeofusca]|uniref:hypothetical protein n=1 Tax=Kitasatospora purpeofusca TaxID=67352 RepID=UPI00386BC512|nr:hypothetical protein OIP63_34560 [Kitasatospora purpeofusca]